MPCPVGSRGASNLAVHQSQLFSNGEQEAEEREPPFPSCPPCLKDAADGFQLNGGGQDAEAGSCDRKEAASAARLPGSGGVDSREESRLIPMTLYLHRVKGLVLALVVEPDFLNDSASMEEVVSADCPAHL